MEIVLRVVTQIAIRMTMRRITLSTIILSSERLAVILSDDKLPNF